jgi:hypothetical protein
MLVFVSGLSLALLSLPAFAAWEKIGESEIGDVFIDKALIKKNGSNIRVMTLVSATHKPVNTRKPGPNSFLKQVEIICRSMELKVISGASYTEPMAKGRVFSREEVGRFAKVVPGTPNGQIAQAACDASSAALK